MSYIAKKGLAVHHQKITLIANHPMTTDGTVCKACNEPFKGGDAITLLPLGPGNDSEARALARAGRAYNAVALPLHYACVTGDESSEPVMDDDRPDEDGGY
jgi:hypothetical protein